MPPKTTQQRVISIRLRASTLLGAFDLCDVWDLPVENMSTAVSLVLERVLNEYRAERNLPTYSEDEANLLLSDRVLEVGRTVKQRKITGQLPVLRTATQKQTSQLADLMVPSTSEFAPWNTESFRNLAGDLPPGNYKVTQDANGEVTSVTDFQFNFGTETGPMDTREHALNLLGSMADLFDNALEEQRQEEEESLLAALCVGDDPLALTPAPERIAALNEVPEDDPHLLADPLYKTLKDDTHKKLLRTIYNNISRELWSTSKANDLLEQMLRGLQ